MAESKADVIELVCRALARGHDAEAKALARERYAFAPAENSGRRYSEHEMLRVFARDGFVDRYSVSGWCFRARYGCSRR